MFKWEKKFTYIVLAIGIVIAIIFFLHNSGII